MFSARGSGEDTGDDNSKQGSFLQSSGLLDLFTTPEKTPEQEHEERVAQLRAKRESQQPARRAGTEEPPSPIKNMNSFCRPKAEEKPGFFQGLMAMVQPAAAEPPAQDQAPTQEPEPGYGDQVMGYFSGLLSGGSPAAAPAAESADPAKSRGSWFASLSGTAEAPPPARRKTADCSESSPLASRAGRVMSDASTIVSGLHQTVTHNVTRVQKHVDGVTTANSEWQRPELGHRRPLPQE